MSDRPDSGLISVRSAEGSRIARGRNRTTRGNTCSRRFGRRLPWTEKSHVITRSKVRILVRVQELDAGVRVLQPRGFGLGRCQTTRLRNRGENRNPP